MNRDINRNVIILQLPAEKPLMFLLWIQKILLTTGNIHGCHGTLPCFGRKRELFNFVFILVMNLRCVFSFIDAATNALSCFYMFSRSHRKLDCNVLMWWQTDVNWWHQLLSQTRGDNSATMHFIYSCSTFLWFLISSLGLNSFTFTTRNALKVQDLDWIETPNVHPFTGFMWTTEPKQ